MNLPNKLTVARVVLVPFFLVFLLIPAIPYNFLWACVVFVIASITDFLDGKIARSRNLVTTFGKFLDPLADKILVTCALVAFVQLGLAHSVAVIIIIARDYMVSAIRMLAVSSNGKVIAANWWGKIKTALQMIAIIGVILACHIVQIAEYKRDPYILYFFAPTPNIMQVQFLSNIIMWVLAVYTLVSGLVYVIQNKELINTVK